MRRSCPIIPVITCEAIGLGLLYLNFKDAVRKGDGGHVLLNMEVQGYRQTVGD